MARSRMAPSGTSTPASAPPRPRWGGREFAVLAFTAVYLVPFGMACLRGGNKEFLLYLAVMLGLVPLVAWLHARIGLHVATLWGLSLWGLAHLAGGLVRIPEDWPHDDTPVLYDLWLVPGRLRYDQIVHALGFGLSTWLCWQALRAAFRAAGVAIRPSPGLLLLCALAGMGLGALNEVVEFIATLMIPNTNVGGYENTGWDLVFNMLGAGVAAILIFLGSSAKPAAPADGARADSVSG
jgi:hypothetical protein